MPLHHDLLTLARHLADRNSSEADRRRAVSTAYYAIFHLLIHESTTRIIKPEAVRSRVVRAFEHRDMKRVCEECSRMGDQNSQSFPPEVLRIAKAFVDLQEARHKSDYNTTDAVLYAEADSKVQLAEECFADWAAVQANPDVDGFLTDLLFQSVRRR